MDEFEAIDTPLDQQDSIPAAKTGGLGVGPAGGGLDDKGAAYKIDIHHCPSAGKSAMFLEYRARLERIYPDAQITGEATPPTQQQTLMRYVRVVGPHAR